MGKLRKRMSFSRINEGLEMPDLIEVQKRSYQRFLETDLKEVLADASPITNYNGNLELTFTDYSLGEPKNSVERCRERDMTYAAPLNIHVHLYDSETSEIKETDVYMGDFPLMTHGGTFVINGAERVVVSQIVRSPGVYFGKELDKSMISIYSSTVIPYHGAWLEYETDLSDVFYVRIDKNRKLPVTVLCRALGLSTNEDILNFFGDDERILATLEKDTTKNQEEGLLHGFQSVQLAAGARITVKPQRIGARRLCFNLEILHEIVIILCRQHYSAPFLSKMRYS